MRNDALDSVSGLSYIDAHCHVGNDVDGRKQTAEDLLEIMNRCGIDHAIIFPFNELEQSHCFKNANTRIAEIMKTYPERFTGFCRLDPHDSCVTELKRCIKDLGLKGLKLHPRAQNIQIDAPYMMPIYEQVGRSNIPLLVHTHRALKGSEPMKLLNVARTFPNVNFILGHTYSGFYSFYSDESNATSYSFGKLLELTRQQKNIYFETSFLTPAYLEGLVKEVGVNQIVFGSDSPYGDPCWEKLTIAELNIPESEKLKICRTNILKLVK
jgi:predicted TIM-barrel fold metal-dependent hydrolase